VCVALWSAVGHPAGGTGVSGADYPSILRDHCPNMGSIASRPEGSNVCEPHQHLISIDSHTKSLKVGCRGLSLLPTGNHSKYIILCRNFSRLAHMYSFNAWVIPCTRVSTPA